MTLLKTGIKKIVDRKTKRQNFNINTESLLFLPDWYVYWKDIEGYYLGCNDAMAERYNFPSRHTLVQNTDYFLPVRKIEADSFRQNDSDVIKKNLTAQFYEPETVFEKETLQLSIKTPLRAKDGTVVGVLGLSRDLPQSPTNDIYQHLCEMDGLSHSVGAFANDLDKWKIQKIPARQEECLFYLVQGMTIKQIARQTNLSPRTVEHYLDALKSKLNCHSRSQLITKALQLPAIKKRLL